MALLPFARRFPLLSLRRAPSVSISSRPAVPCETSSLREWGWWFEGSHTHERRNAIQGDCLGFVPLTARFSAPQAYEIMHGLARKAVTRPELTGIGLDGREALEVQDFLLGMAPLKKTFPLVFAKLELALMLWFERRSTLQPESVPWSTWLSELPEANDGSLPFLGSNRSSVGDLLASNSGACTDDLANLKDEVARDNMVVDMFCQAVVNECEELLDVYYNHGLWAPPTNAAESPEPQRQADFSVCAFSDLFRMDYSLVLAGGLHLANIPRSSVFQPDEFNGVPLEEVAFFPGFEFLAHSFKPNAEIVFMPTRHVATQGDGLLLPVDTPSEIGLALLATREISPGEEIRILRASTTRDLLFLQGQLDPSSPC